MNTLTKIKRFVLALCLATPLVSWAATYSTYKDDATTFRTGAYGNANYQRFKINADWMFNTDGNDIAATADAVKLDSIKVYWHSSGHNNADIGRASGTELDPYLVVTTPQGVIVGISAAGEQWSANGSSTFEFTNLVISPNAQYYYYFATDVSSLTVGGAMSGAKQARFTGAWHGANSGSVTSDQTVCVMDDGRYSIRCDFEVSAATATTITTTSDGVSLSTGSDPVVVKGAVADGVVTVDSDATVPALTVVGEATTLKLTDSLTATYLYLPATTTIDASDVTFTMPGSDETEATTTLVIGKISAASNPSVTLPTPAEGYAFESPAYTDAGIAVTITKFADASLDIGSSTVNWSEVKPEGWVNSPVPKITVAYTDGGKIVFDEEVQAASIELNGADKLTIERSEGVDVNISELNFINDDPANVEFVNFTRIPTFGQNTLSTDTIGISGSDTLTGAPSPISNNAAEGTFNFAQPLNFTGDGFYLFGNKTVNFNAGTDATFTRLVLGNSNGTKTQTVNQNAGTVTVTGNSGPTSNQASILLGHWGSTVALKTLGGTFTADNAISRLGWDGTATWAIGGGSSAATVNALGIQNGGNGHSGTGTLNILQNGTLNLGSGGINFQNSSNGGAINLAGGTIAARADLTIANSKAGGTILNQNKTTTINTDSNTVTLSAPLSGAGALTKTGSGVLKVTGAGTATGGVTVSGGTLRFEGSGAKIGTGNINLTGEGAKLELVPGEGNTITLAPQYLINSTGQNSTPVIEVGAGTVVIADTGSSANGHFAYSTINILNGGDMQLTKGDLLGYNFTYPINIAAGGKLTISKRETFTRDLNLNGGSVYLVKNDADDRALDLFNGMGTITVTADSSIDSETDAATIWVRKQAANVSVNSGATLTLNAIVETTDPYADTNGGITKSGDGTLKLTKANTSTGSLAVNAGVLELDGGSWAGPVALAAGTTLNVVTESEIGPGGTIATFGSGSTFGEGVVVQINGETVDDAAIDANGVVTRVVPITYVAITVPTVANASVVVSDGTNTYTPTTAGGTSYSVPAGSTITVTYTAAEGYELEGTSSYTLTNVAEGDAVTITDTEAKPYVAQFNNVKYTTVQGAINAWAAVTDQATAYLQVSLLGDVTESSVTIPVGAAGMPCQINGGNHTLTAPVTINAGAFLSPTALTIAGNLTVNGTYYRIGPAAIAVSGALTFGDGATIAVTALSSETSVFAASGAVTISGDLNVLLYSETLTAGEYTIATGASVTRAADSQVVVTLNETVTDTWALSNTETAVVLTGAAARVNGDTYPTFTEAVTAANGTDTIELLAAASYTLTAGETVIVKAGSFTFTVSAPQGYVISETTVSDDVVSYTTGSALVRTTKEVNDSGTWRTADGYPKEYASIVAAIADITIAPVENSTRYTVTMLGNETLATRAEPNCSMTIDLGGYTLTREGTSGNGSVFDVKSGTVTIKNGTIDCTQDDTAIVKDGVYAITARSGSAVTLTGLTVTVNSKAGACVYPFSGATVTINSGTYKNETAEEYQYKAGWIGMAVNQANVATQLITIYGGSFKQNDPALGDDSWADGAGTFVAAGYESTEDNGVWVVAALPNYTVTFDADGGTPAPAAQTVQKGSTATAPAEPTKDGFTFAGWTLGGSAYDFATPVTGNITLVASWTSSGINPTVDGSMQEVTPTAEEIAAAGSAEAAAIAKATVTVPAEVTGVDAPTYKTYFKFSATATETDGVYAVTITGFADEVTETADGNALAALEAATAGTALGTITVKPGLYYGTAAGADVTTLKAPAGELNTTGTLNLGVTKPSTGEAYFIKIKVGTTAFTAEE